MCNQTRPQHCLAHRNSASSVGPGLLCNPSKQMKVPALQTLASGCADYDSLRRAAGCHPLQTPARAHGSQVLALQSCDWTEQSPQPWAGRCWRRHELWGWLLLHACDVLLPALDFFLPAFGVTREKDARLRRCFFASTIVGGKKPARPRRCFFASAYGAKKGRGPEKVWFCQGMGVFFCQRICRRAQVRGEMRLTCPVRGGKNAEKN